MNPLIATNLLSMAPSSVESLPLSCWEWLPRSWSLTPRLSPTEVSGFQDDQAASFPGRRSAVSSCSTLGPCAGCGLFSDRHLFGVQKRGKRAGRGTWASGSTSVTRGSFKFPRGKTESTPTSVLAVVYK